MKTKICNKCKINKPLSDFEKRANHKDNLDNWCKICRNDYRHLHVQNNPWYTSYRKLKERCNNFKSDNYRYYGGRGIKSLITLKEIKTLWFRDKAYLLKRPSIERKNSSKDYTFENCEFIEMGENIGRSCRKPILQFDLDGNFIKEWPSASHAGKAMNRNPEGIRQCLIGKTKKSNNFIWKYKNV